MILTCTHCGVIFREPRTPIIGVSKDQITAKIMDEAGQHMAKKHAANWLPLMTAWVPKLGFLWLMLNTKTEDRELVKSRDATCAEFVRLCGRQVTDDDIRKAVDKARAAVGEPGLPADAIPVNAVMRMMKELRDLLRYEDLFPQDPPPAGELPRAA